MTIKQLADSCYITYKNKNMDYQQLLFVGNSDEGEKFLNEFSNRDKLSRVKKERMK